MVRPMVHSTKHYVQNSIATIMGGAQLVVSIATSVAVGAKNVPAEVEEGNSIKAIYFEEWMRSAELSGGSFVACIYKLPGAAVAFTTAQMAQLHDAENKKNILWTSQGLVNDVDADALGMLRNWIKIPKSKQRMGLGDQIVLQVFAQGGIDLHLCGFAVFKEYS